VLSVTRMALRVPMHIAWAKTLDDATFPCFAVPAISGIRAFTYNEGLIPADYLTNPEHLDFEGDVKALPEGLDGWVYGGVFYVYDYTNIIVGSSPYLERVISAKTKLRGVNNVVVIKPTIVESPDAVLSAFSAHTVVYLRDMQSPYIQPMKGKPQKNHKAWLQYQIPEKLLGTILEIVDKKVIVIGEDGDYVVCNISNSVDNLYLNKFKAELEGCSTFYIKQGVKYYFYKCDKMKELIDGTVQKI
jgi:hypothetical protein